MIDPTKFKYQGTEQAYNEIKDIVLTDDEYDDICKMIDVMQTGIGYALRAEMIATSEFASMLSKEERKKISEIRNELNDIFERLGNMFTEREYNDYINQ